MSRITEYCAGQPTVDGASRNHSCQSLQADSAVSQSRYDDLELSVVESGISLSEVRPDRHCSPYVTPLYCYIAPSRRRPQDETISASPLYLNPATAFRLFSKDDVCVGGPERGRSSYPLCSSDNLLSAWDEEVAVCRDAVTTTACQLFRRRSHRSIYSLLPHK